MEPIYSEKELLHQIAESNPIAFRKIFDLYRIRLFSFILEFTHSPADAEEIVQETFMKLWENRRHLAQVDHPGGYIYRMARNNTLNWLARVSRNEKLHKLIWSNMQMTGNSTEDQLDVRESKHLIAEALSGLPDKKQVIFRLSREEGLKHEEIAQRLGLSKSTVKNILVETLKYIKTFLGHQLPVLAFFSCFPIFL